jgi:hypothetical protein
MMEAKMHKIIGLIVVIAMLFLWFWNGSRPGYQRLKSWTPTEKKHVIQRMKFHGIESCVKDAKGYYFIRNGKRHKL